MKKKYLLLLLVTTILLTATAISAADSVDDTQSSSQDTSQISTVEPTHTSNDNSQSTDTNSQQVSTSSHSSSDTVETTSTQTHDTTKSTEKTSTSTQQSSSQKTLKSSDDTQKITENTQDKTETAKTVSTESTSSKNLTKDTETIYYSNGTNSIDPITIDSNVTIIGESRDGTILTTDSSNAMITVTETGQLTLINITVSDFVSGDTAAIVNYGVLTVNNTHFDNNGAEITTSQGGSIYSKGTLYVYDSEFSNSYASYGASIYNAGKATINNSYFENEGSLNVGGSIYNTGDLTISNSTSTLNYGVSGAGIHNSFGNLTVEECLFYKNSATSFYGGAIYSTGKATARNTQFLYNSAVYNGGAITNTADFTLTNCTFTANTAGEDGGAIENIAWESTEHGNLNLINCTFTDNSANDRGGAIINLNTTPLEYNPGTITATGCEFDSNSAGDSGGAIYNCENNFINLEYNVLMSNNAEEATTIYTNPDDIISVEYNWWGSNDNNWTKMGIEPDKWFVMTFTNTTSLVDHLDSTLLVTINTLNTNETASQLLPERQVVFLGNSTYSNNYVEFNDEVLIDCVPEYENITAVLDNQRITLMPNYANVTYSLVDNNQTLEFTMNYNDESINGKTSLKINGKTIFDRLTIENGALSINYSIPTSWNKDTYTFSVVLRTDDGRVLNKNITIEIPKREVNADIQVISDGPIRAGSTVQLVATLTTGDKNIETGRVAFKINGVTIETNVTVVNGQAIINYTIPDDFSAGDYEISIVYSGDDNKESVRGVTTNLTVEKQEVHTSLDPDTPLEFMSGAGVSMRVILYDLNDNIVTKGKVCYKINGLTVKTNITLEDGVFFLEFITPEVPEGQTLNQTLTIKMGENNKYKLMTVDIPIIIVG